jgi:hypothetical protein
MAELPDISHTTVRGIRQAFGFSDLPPISMFLLNDGQFRDGSSGYFRSGAIIPHPSQSISRTIKFGQILNSEMNIFRLIQFVPIRKWLIVL